MKDVIRNHFNAPFMVYGHTHGSTSFVGAEIYPAPAWWKATPLSMTACSLLFALPGKRFSSSHKALRIDPRPLPCSCRSGTSTALATSFAHSSHACTTGRCSHWCIRHRVRSTTLSPIPLLRRAPEFLLETGLVYRDTEAIIRQKCRYGPTGHDSRKATRVFRFSWRYGLCQSSLENRFLSMDQNLEPLKRCARRFKNSNDFHAVFLLHYINTSLELPVLSIA